MVSTNTILKLYHNRHRGIYFLKGLPNLFSSIYLALSMRHSSVQYTNVILKLLEVGTMTAPILQIRKLRCNEVK